MSNVYSETRLLYTVAYYSEGRNMSGLSFPKIEDLTENDQTNVKNQTVLWWSTEVGMLTS